MNLTFNHKQLVTKLYEFSWRIAVLLLPLQTRLYKEAFLNGHAWEQGRLSFYISWIPIVAVIALGIFNSKKELSLNIRKNIFLIITFFGVVNIVAFPYAVTASAQWWVQQLLLLLFFITLYKNNTSLDKLAFWFLVSILPSAIFAIAQSWLQFVPGWSWIGVATQNPMDLGVSVVQSGSLRWLRAYGFFPHPNILGGYMAFGILISFWLYLLPVKNNKKFLLAIVPFITTALFYSFSRSAWIAAFVGLLILFIPLVFKRQWKKILTSLVVVVTFSILIILHWDLASTRFGFSPEPVRLEQISNQARTNSLLDGVKVFQANPLFGTGPNAELPALVGLELSQNKKTDWLEPPHNVWLLFLVNFGVFGALLMVGFFLRIFINSHFKLKKLILQPDNLSLAMLGAWFVLTLFDHYPYSLWSGQVLTIFALSSLIIYRYSSLER
ncbi:O-antigen ligase family protein [Patescibacteria group bacterium]|nr:O-antigen ligase family protein [Patescibacteria group bacterium]